MDHVLSHVLDPFKNPTPLFFRLRHVRIIDLKTWILDPVAVSDSVRVKGEFPYVF